jgi:hypothetical protein
MIAGVPSSPPYGKIASPARLSPDRYRVCLMLTVVVRSGARFFDTV